MDTEFFEEGDYAWEFTVPEAVGSPTLIDGQPVFAGWDVLKEIRAVLETEDEGYDEVHCAGEI